ncbi:MAG: NAD(+)/NADH kinase [Clostridia bacterium]|nr:NAD(+)/NADH kinase [Clostridia bacterium]
MKQVVIIPVIRKENDDMYTTETVSHFINNGAEVWMDVKHSTMQYANGAKFACGDDLYKNCDLIVVLGGDGSILRAAEKALTVDVPILGVNLGRLGYMAELEKDELHLINNIYKGKYRVEERMVLSIDVCRDGETFPIRDALNDVVINRGGYTRSIDIDLYADGKSVRTIRADGLILSTPTGSTAYSMSAGGSVLDPTLECICATPICPSSRYACPIVFSGNSTLTVIHSDDRNESWNVTIDGEGVTPLRCGEELIIRRSEKYVKMLSLKDEGFFETLNNKISKYELKK